MIIYVLFFSINIKIVNVFVIIKINTKMHKSCSVDESHILKNKIKCSLFTNVLNVSTAGNQATT